VATQVENGKAFEFAVAQTLSHRLSIPVVASEAQRTALSCFEERISASLRARFKRGASLAASHILEKESARLPELALTQIELAADSRGQSGDVRDVVVTGRNGSFGISCKTNHDAFKHSRLSGTIDFVKDWGIDPQGCSGDYWDAVSQIFVELRKIRKDSGATALWRDLSSVPERFYWPVLNAFQAELSRLTMTGSPDSGIKTRNLVRYIIGNQDFYKVVVRPEQVEIQGFNPNGSLSVHNTKLPDHVVGIDTLNGGQYSKTVRFNNGFTFNFRIHSASSRVEPSLKFDVRAVALPPKEIYTNHISLL
jgi:hypothetical protein